MARVTTIQQTFSRGEISEKLYGRTDTELYYQSLKRCENFVVDGRGILEKRPGTAYVDKTPGTGNLFPIPPFLSVPGELPCRLIPFPQSPRDSIMLSVTTHGIGAYIGYRSLGSPGPYTIFRFGLPGLPEDVIQGISFAQSGRSMFLATAGATPLLELVYNGDPNSPSFGTQEPWIYDGPYEAPNADPTQQLSMASDGTLTATGFSPFTSAMIGRWVRMETPDTESDDPEVLGDQFLWAWFQITSFTSSTQVGTSHAGGQIQATPNWRMGVFYADIYPDGVAIHEGRLALSYRNRVFFSKAQDFLNFGPSRQTAVEQIVGSYRGMAVLDVQPGDGISVYIDTGATTQGGEISGINWMRSINFQLVLGTPGGLLSIQANSFGAALEPGNVTVRPQDSRGASHVSPISVADSILFPHVSGKRVHGTYFRDSYDRIAARDLSLAADTVITDQVRQMAWQDYPHSIVWMCLEDGRLLGFTLQPEEGIQAWHRHRLGGQFIEDNRKLHPHVMSVATMPAPDGIGHDLWMCVKRTINGETIHTVEVLRPFRQPGDDVRDAWYLDCALRYDGNVDEDKTISFSIPDGPNEPWTVTTDFASPALTVDAKFSIHDGTRWHRGTVVSVDGSNNFEFLPAAPNSPPGPADGLRWFWDGTEWTQPTEGSVFRPAEATYIAPDQEVGVTRWSLAEETLFGIDHLAGETVSALLDGIPSTPATVGNDGTVSFGVAASVALVGYPYEAVAALMRPEAGSQNGTALNKQTSIYERGIDVWQTHGVEVGTGQMYDYAQTWAYYEPVDFEMPLIEGEPALLFDGYKRVTAVGQGPVDAPDTAIRSRDPLPCAIRAVITRLSTSDGR